MVSAESEIWVTGMSWSTALGASIDGVWQSLLKGVSGIVDMDTTVALRSNYGAPIKAIPEDWPPQQRQHTLTVDVLSRALHDAGIAADHPELLPVMATSYGSHLDQPGFGSLEKWSLAVTESLDCQNEPITITTACSAGSDAIQVGVDLLRSGFASLCVCGGADVLSLGKRIGHSGLGTLSPSHQLRAFDSKNVGTLLGEGAAFLVLEHGEHARARGARGHGIILGAGSANDAANAVAPESSGANVILAVDRALSAAGRSPSDVAVINAHGSGTSLNDIVESRAYSKLFKQNSPPPIVFATKGAFGHTLGATGAIEAIATLLALKNWLVPPVLGLQEVLPALELPIAIDRPMALHSGLGLSITLGFGGFNTCLVFDRLAEAVP